METHLDAWTREVTDARVHGTTGETPDMRFGREEASALRPSTGIPPSSAPASLLRVAVGRPFFPA